MALKPLALTGWVRHKFKKSFRWVGYENGSA